MRFVRATEIFRMTLVALAVCFSVSVTALSSETRRVEPATPGYNEISVRHAWSGGEHGLFSRTDNAVARKGVEYPVLRDNAIIGLFTVNFTGRLNTWGEFNSEDESLPLRQGDVVALPEFPLERPPEGRPLNDVPHPRIVFALPGKDQVLVNLRLKMLRRNIGMIQSAAVAENFWCMIDRGRADGLKGGEHALVFSDTNDVVEIGEFDVLFAGNGWSYGIFRNNTPERPLDFKTSYVIFSGK